MAWITTCRGFCQNPQYSYGQRRTFQGFTSQVKKIKTFQLFVIQKNESFQCKVFVILLKPTHGVLAHTKTYMKGILNEVTGTY